MEAYSENFIYFLQLSPVLPEEYIRLAAKFKKWGIDLVPVKVTDLPQLTRGKCQFVISLCADMTSYRHLAGFRKRYLDFTILNQKYCHFDISSFPKSDIAYKTGKTGHYHYYQLPFERDELVELIVKEFFSKTRKEKRWPGGRRAKLPPMPGERA